MSARASNRSRRACTQGVSYALDMDSTPRSGERRAMSALQGASKKRTASPEAKRPVAKKPKTDKAPSKKSLKSSKGKENTNCDAPVSAGGRKIKMEKSAVSKNSVGKLSTARSAQEAMEIAKEGGDSLEDRYTTLLGLRYTVAEKNWREAQEAAENHRVAAAGLVDELEGEVSRKTQRVDELKKEMTNMVKDFQSSADEQERALSRLREQVKDLSRNVDDGRKKKKANQAKSQIADGQTEERAKKAEAALAQALDLLSCMSGCKVTKPDSKAYGFHFVSEEAGVKFAFDIGFDKKSNEFSYGLSEESDTKQMEDMEFPEFLTEDIFFERDQCVTFFRNLLSVTEATQEDDSSADEESDEENA